MRFVKTAMGKDTGVISSVQVSVLSVAEQVGFLKIRYFRFFYIQTITKFQSSDVFFSFSIGNSSG